MKNSLDSKLQNYSICSIRIRSRKWDIFEKSQPIRTYIFREQLNQKASEDEKARLVRFTEEKNNQILHYNNKLAQLQTRLDQGRFSSFRFF